jgi:outer membrane protein assembly factor BamD
MAKNIMQLSDKMGAEAESRLNGNKAMFTKALVGALLFAGLTGCVQKNDSSALENVDFTEPADRLYNQALANISAKRAGEGRKKLEAVQKQHPDSEYAQKAAVLLVFSNYRAGNYAGAIKNGKKFIENNPSHKEAAYVQYLIGMSYYRQIPDVTRDQSITLKAMKAMEEVVQNYPKSEYVGDAKTKIRVTRDQLAGKSMQVGRYYQERKEYLAAIKRFRGVVEKYQNTRHVEEALARLTESYFAIGLTGEAQTAAAILGHNFPDSQWYRDSYKLLATGGLEPRENTGSWLSRAGKLITGA